MINSDYWIKKLNLEKHPEGGYFKEVYRSKELVNPATLFDENRTASTAIYYLLKNDSPSCFHRIRSDEIWHFYFGSEITIYEINKEGNLITHYLGNSINHSTNAMFQICISAENWFAAEVKAKDGFAVVGCTVAPGFEFGDFELGQQESLLSEYQQHKEIIKRLTP